MRRICLGAFVALLAAVLAPASAATFTVTNTGPEALWQQVVLLPDKSGATTVSEAGKPLACQRVADGLLVLLPGLTAPTAERVLSTRTDKLAAVSTDLRVTQSAAVIAVSNAYFRVEHPKKGGGGFPTTIRFNQSGVVERGFVFEDRLWEKSRTFCTWRGDTESTARVVESGPLQVVVETRAAGRGIAGNPRAVYRYRYRASSPVVEVTARIERDDDFAWSELHFLQISRKDNAFPKWAGGDPIQQGTFVDARKGYDLPRWAMMANDQDAVGLAPEWSVSLYDGIGDYYNYIQRVLGPFTERAIDLRANLYLGPARPAERIGQALTDAPKVAVREGGAGPDVVERNVPRPAARRLENGTVSFGFAAAAEGMGLVSLFSQRTGHEFLTGPSEKPLLWRLVLRGPDATDIRLDNTTPARCSLTERATQDAKVAELTWAGIALEGEPDALTVRVRVELPLQGGTALWSIDVDNRSRRYGLWEVYFPLFLGLSEAGVPDVAVPRSNWGCLYRGLRSTTSGFYPSCDWPMQFLLLNEQQHGLYLAAHDPGASTKWFTLNPGNEFHFRTAVENMGVPGSSFHAPFPFAVGVYQGDWWQGAKRYRQWALRQPWTAKGPVATRKDMPQAMKDLGLWILSGGTRQEVVPGMMRAQKLFGVPLGVHWYSWHEIPFDVHYPNYFPTKPGFATGVGELTKAGMIAMPYINGRLWDVANENFAQGRAGACKQPDGVSTYIEEYGSGAKLAPMCPTTKIWQDKVTEIVRRLIDECGVNAIYLDQIAAAGPALCFDKSHGHPLGGGRHWVDGYRVLLNRVRALTKGRVGITTENNAEPYMDNVDAFLVWNPRADFEIPMMTAVYSGYTIYFSSPARTMEPLAFRMVQGRDFLWGCQPGWMGFELLEPANRANAEYLREVARYRKVAADFVVTGELRGELRPLAEPASVEATWAAWSGTWPATLPATMGTVWRARDGRGGLLIANLSDQPQRFSYRFDPSAWGLKAAKQWTLSQLTPGKAGATVSTPVALLPGTPARRTESLAPREIRVIEVAPTPAGKAAAIQAQIRKAKAKPAPVAAAASTGPTTDVRFLTPPRAGESCVLQVHLRNGETAAATTRVVLDLPAAWSAEPGRALILDGLKPAETRTFLVRCDVPAGAEGSTFVRANVVQLQPGRRVDVAPARPTLDSFRFPAPPVIDGDLTEWADAPVLTLDGAAQSRVKEWQGAADLSAKVRVGWDATHFYFAAAVNDNAFDQIYRDKDVWQGDCIQLALRPGGPPQESTYDGVHEFGLARTPVGPQGWMWFPDERAAVEAKLAVVRGESGLVYEAAIPWTAIGGLAPAAGLAPGFSFTLNDADGEGFRGWMEWTPGVCGGAKDALHFGRLRL
ncbi:MAG: hypothetical protein GX774_17485 [Armatimonadetes bacterium]|nr:hypothetical protein [Armatimonadota bacterium]